MLSEEEWKTFFDLMKRITEAPVPWYEKEQEVKDQAEARDATYYLNEFTEWFQRNRP